MEKNKTGKYLKYAIGEIVLVVIGILIALQINNWNESRKNSSLVNTYKKRLIENLVKDSLNIHNKLIEINEDIKRIEDFEQRVSKSNEPFDIVRDIAREEYEFIIHVLTNYENETYQILNSTGHLALFSQNVADELNSLYNLQETATQVSNLTLDNYSRGLSNYSKSYPFTFRNNLFQNGTVAADKIWNNISLSNHATEFNSLIILKSDSYRLSLSKLPEIQDGINQLLKTLRE
ncbi:MAG: DUF6090 family protein [Winogradskyella sp.]|uniref:DUF6090 family protein n=1 Tax=Winogradskyella sp. TaxID=1883156 RepID=UPI0038586D24